MPGLICGSNIEPYAGVTVSASSVYQDDTIYDAGNACLGERPPNSLIGNLIANHRSLERGFRDDIVCLYITVERPPMDSN